MSGFCQDNLILITTKIENNRKYKVLCQAAVVYIEQVKRYYAKSSDTYLLATRLCDSYGLDTMVMQPLIRWLSQCYDKGILSDMELQLKDVGDDLATHGLLR